MSTSPTPSELDLKRRIMRRVYALWFWRSVAPLLAVEVIMLTGVAVGVLTHISVSHIAANAMAASGSAWALAKFFSANFFVKSIQSRLLAGAYLALVLFFIRDLVSALRRLRGFHPGELASAILGTGNQRPASLGQ